MKKFEGFKVKGKPFFALGAQAHNSSSYSREMFRETCKATLALNCNTVEAPIYWEKIEPREGIFDFTSIDYMLEICKANRLRLVILWFASWKNGDISYAPEWVKKDQVRFQRVLRADGVPVADLSAHYAANRDADAKALAAVCAYLKKTDESSQTVIAIQVENEPGYLKTDRDFSEKALQNQKAAVPAQLFSYLENHKNTPPGKDWIKNGSKQGLSWFETFGFHGYEYCEAWHLAKYIDEVTAAGKAQYGIPFYINVWLNNGNPWGVPGMEYPGGGAVVRTLHIWQAAVENIDCIAPDIYEQNSFRYENTCDIYNTEENALFIPESHPNLSGSCNMFYAIASGAIGVATFGCESCIDDEGNITDAAIPLRDSNKAIRDIMPMILKHKNTGKIYSVVPHTDQGEQGYEFTEFLGSVQFKDGRFFDYCDRRDKTPAENRTARGLIIEDENKTFYLAGRFGLSLVPKKSPEITIIRNHFPSPDFVSVEEGHFDDNGNFVCDRIRNGDEAFFGGFWVTPNCGVVRVKLL